VAGGSSFLVGISSGAALSLAAAAQGLPISKMALYEPPFMVDDEGHHPPIDSVQQLKLLIAADRRGDAVKFFLKDMVAVPAIFVFMIQLLPIWSKLKAVAHTLPYDASVMDGFSLPSKYAFLVSVSTLVIGGQKSPATMRHAVEALAKILPNSDLQMLKGQTHNVSEKILAPVLANFFA
jgi:pimeloyl-ACP methyl ester carboxylesterase